MTMTLCRDGRAGARRCRTALAGLGLALLGALPMQASAQAVRDEAPVSYTVQPGDTLWGIAARYLDAPWQWQRLWRRNPQLDAPSRLYPGDVIRLDTDARGAPGLHLERGPGAVVRLSPEMRRAPQREAVPSLPLDRVRVFLDAYQIVDPAQLDNAPTVLAGSGQRLLSGAGDTLYARGELPASGAQLGVYRPATDYRRLDARAEGLELHRLGHVRVRRRDGDIAELVVLDAAEEIRSGDYLLALDEGGITTRFLPRPPPLAVEATILSVPAGVRFIGRHDVIAIDQGAAGGLETGHVLTVMHQGERVHDETQDDWVTLPDTEAGAVMIFRVFEHLSYALVMRASQALVVGDRLVTP
ncbi:LysM peptidoglycan-binding domain-containing protein [Salinicola avicenniae]|uniref:LysM peptidoglycan-binding domain-containing protein n=1 Tax=Salinicola avicenniae TaxID=2916836 RepID=UPI0020737F40|nr:MULTISPECIES: LysM domain-containing protein [unclassified Salinicola]